MPTKNRPALGPLLKALLSDSPAPGQIKAFADLCHRMALAYLGKKAKGGHLNPSFFGLSLEDLAFDCIAALFERGPKGRFTQLEGYFQDPHHKSDEQLLARTRRLVFSAVEQELFSHYGEMDPGLSKLIRNLKRAAKQHERLFLERPDGELWIVCKDEQKEANDQPLMPGEFLEKRLMPYLEQNITAPQVLEAFETVILPQRLYRKALPVTLLAQSVRAGLAKLKEEARASSAANEYHADRLQPEEIRQMIQASVKATQKAKRPSYVGKGKVDPSTYGHYFQAIEELLTDRFVGPQNAETFYEHLNNQLSLSKQAYQQKHRTRLEYLVQLTRQQFLEMARQEL